MAGPSDLALHDRRVKTAVNFDLFILQILFAGKPSIFTAPEFRILGVFKWVF